MGNGAAVQQQVQRWDEAVAGLTALCDELRQDAKVKGVLMTSGTVSLSLRTADVRRSSIERPHISLLEDSPVDAECGASVRLPDGAGSSDGAHAKFPRHVSMENRRMRTSRFKSYEDTPETTDLACSHFATVAVALSVLLGGGQGSPDRKLCVTVEDLFFAAQIPLHMAHSESIFLTQLFDIVQEFINVDNRFKGQYEVEVVHFDVAPVVGSVEIGSNDVGDRQPRVTPSEFRKVVTQELDENTDAVRVVSFDAYVAEQEMLVDDNDDDSTEDILSASTYKSKSISSLASLADVKGGVHTTAFASIVDYRNAVEYLLTTARGSIGKRLTVQIEEVPLPALYKAMAYIHNNGRARGYLRIWKRQVSEVSCHDAEGTFVSEELCSGKVVGSLSDGTNANTTSELISPFIVAAAWALHFIQGALPDRHNHGFGLPISRIIRTLRLSSEEYIKCDMPLDQAYLRVRDFLCMTPSLGENFAVSMHPVLTNVSRQSAVPSLSMSELETLLIRIHSANTDREAPNVLMIVQYNPDIAHNVIGISKSSQWAVVVGIDDNTIRLIDGNALKFCATWYCSLEQLHRAMTNFGYLLLVRTESHAGFADDLPLVALQRVRFVERQLRAAPPLGVVTYPAQPLTLSTLALALRRVGIDATLDDIVQRSPTDVSALLGSALPLEACAMVVRSYLAARGIDDVGVALSPMEIIPNAGMSLHEENLSGVLSAVEDETSAVVAFFAGEFLSVHGVMRPFGDSAVVTAVDRTWVTMMDANPLACRRTWNVTPAALYIAMSKNVSHRNHGLMVITKGISSEGTATPIAGMPFRWELAPLQQPFAVSPSAHMQALSLAFAQIGHFYSPEELFYEAYLKTMTNQRRRGSQAFAWRDVEVSLAILNRKMDARVMHQVASSFLTHRRVNDVHATLVSVEPSGLSEALEGAVGSPQENCQQVLLICYDTKALYGSLAVDAPPNSVGLVKWFDASSGRVGCLDAEYIAFGPEWSCTVEKLAQIAGTTSGIPLVKLSLGKGESMAVGRGFRGFGEARGSGDGREARGSGSRASVTFEM